ncbi:MAG: rhomboid family intramembrane serine protease [Euzebyales bacterium]|nr:rhomboid family intramembrane serine protease [Euzebyales bacterium]
MDAETALPTCYRHPDRETRIACSSCERPICVECMNSASVGQKCPECAAPVGRSKVIHARDLQRNGWRLAPFSYTVVGICVVLAVLAFVVPGIMEPVYLALWQDNAAVGQGDVWRLLTATLVHSPGSIWHVGFNMYALTIFGPPLERDVGTVPFAALYVACALAGGAAFFVASPTAGVAVGASGAIFGLFGAWLAASLRTRHTLQGSANLRQLMVLLAINLALPLLIPRIAWEAHLGGLVAGFLILIVWSRLSADGQALAVRRAMIAVAVGAISVLAVLLR